MAATTMNQPASGAGSELAYIQETAFGTTPATPSLIEVRCLPPRLDPAFEAFISEQINALRVASNIRHTYRGGSMEIPMELSYAAADEFLSAALGGEWQTDTPSAGIDALDFGGVDKSYFFELARLDAKTPYFIPANGTVFTGFDLNIEADGNSAISATFNAMVGEVKAPTTATADAGGGYTAAPSNLPMVAADGAVTIDASGVDLLGLSLSFSDPRSAQRKIGAKAAVGFIPDGRRTLSGSITGYAAEKSYLDRLINETETAIIATLTDPAGNALALSLPTVKLTGYSEPQGGNSIRFTASFEAYDASGASPMRITRNPA